MTARAFCAFCGNALLVFVYIHVLGVDDVVLTSTTRGRGARCRRLITCRFTTGIRRWRLLIKCLSQLVRRSLQLIERVVQLLDTALSQRRLRLSDCRFDISRNWSDFLAIVRERLLHLIDEAIETIARFDLFALASVVRGVRLGVSHHLVDLVLRQT